MRSPVRRAATAVQAYCAIVQRWALAATELLTPVPKVFLPMSCPRCSARFAHHRSGTGERLEQSAPHGLLAVKRPGRVFVIVSRPRLNFHSCGAAPSGHAARCKPHGFYSIPVLTPARS
jgi:hypothetical protein